MDVFDAAERYKQEGRSLIVLAGKEYGSGKWWNKSFEWTFIQVLFIGIAINLIAPINVFKKSYHI